MSVNAPQFPAPGLLPVRRALISVSDKSGLKDLAAGLDKFGVDLISTGGTAKALRDLGYKLRDVSELTNFQEIMDGRVKTLHPNVHGGLLAVRANREHTKAMEDNNIEPIDLTIVNLYPFEKVRDSGADYGAIVENIDIGGPAMLRASAKNHAYVAIVTSPDEYEALLSELEANDGALSYGFRQGLAAKAFARAAHYDSAIAAWFANQLDNTMPSQRSFSGTLHTKMRYGENPHQSAALYATGEKRPGVISARLMQGKALSYNNVNDTDAAFELVSEFNPDKGAAVAIIKHANPCGVAQGPDLLSAYLHALRCDSVSAFGGIIALNQAITGDVAREIIKTFTEVVIAPDATQDALELFATKKNLRLLLSDGLPNPADSGLQVKSVAGGLLVQTRDNGQIDDLDLKVVTKRAPTPREMDDMIFAARVAKHVKSNAIVYARDGATVGIGAGQMSRVDSARIAAQKGVEASQEAGETTLLTTASVVASDAFFPFADGLLCAIEAGATAVIQPGGSMRDDEVIAAANEHDIAMVMTGMRHFKH